MSVSTGSLSLLKTKIYGEIGEQGQGVQDPSLVRVIRVVEELARQLKTNHIFFQGLLSRRTREQSVGVGM